METAPETTVPDKATVERFLETFQDTPGSLYNAAAFLREFSRYLSARGIRAYLIPSGRLHLPTPVQPYFFTEQEILAFFRECDRTVEAPRLKGRNLVLPAIFRLIYCCGLRRKEARMLARENAHLDEGFLDILQSKGPKSRRIHISGELVEYLVTYDRRISRLFPEHVTFFRTGRTIHTVPAGWKKTFCASGMPPSRRKREPASASAHMISDITLYMPT